MISVAEAKEIINNAVHPIAPADVLLESAYGCVLAADIYAPYDIPAYPQSSMDGYAFAFRDINHPLTVIGESAAGNRQGFRITDESAARVFTGAAVPHGADTVVMQEKIKFVDGKLFIEDDTLAHGINVRSVGSEIRKGAMALAKYTVLTPAAIGFLAGIGVTHVSVYPFPRIAIILTGNELKQPGNALAYGEVYESNSFALRAALKQFNLPPPSIYYAKDNVAELTSILATALSSHDIILLTGGVSVGDYDFVTKAAEQCSVSTLFHKIKQRPGKPLFFGMRETQTIFGLPGNPSSVLTCFYQYVLPAIGLMCKKPLELPTLNVTVHEGFSKKIKFTQFLKGYYDGNTVTILSAQESYKMNSFATANCFVVMPEELNELRKGDIAEIHLFA